MRYFIFKVKKIVLTVLGLSCLLLVSCKEDSYLNAIPDNVVTLMAVDAEKSGLSISTEDIDTKEKIYFFEMADGTLGMAARYQGHSNGFKTVADKWVCGFGDGKMVILGPVLPAQFEEVRQRIQRLMEQGEDESIVGKPLLSRVDSLKSPIGLVAQAEAVPEQFAALFTLCAPKNADPSMVYLAAEAELDKGVLRVKGSNFSFNKNLQSAMDEASKAFRPLKGVYKDECEAHLLSVVMNADGNQLLPLMQQNKSLQMLLAGMNAAVDMDNIIRSVDGEMALMLKNGNMDMTMRAQLGKRDFIKDVAYWKSSCPQGSRIIDQGKDKWLYESGDIRFYFEVTPANEFIGRLTHEKGDGEHLVESALEMVRPFTGDLKAVVYQIGTAN